MKPKPLDLEDLKETWIKIESLDGMPKFVMQRRFGTFEIFQEIKQRIKQACEFYLKYKDKPELLVKEHPHYRKSVLKTAEEWWKYPQSIFSYRKYNELLFKLAFKDVLEEKK